MNRSIDFHSHFAYSSIVQKCCYSMLLFLLLGSLWLGPVPRCRRSHFGPPASGRLLLGRMLAACDHAVPPAVVVSLASFLSYFGSTLLHMPLPTTFTAPAPPGSDDICDFETILYGRARVALSTWRVDVCLFASSAIKSRSGIGADMCVPGMAGWAA